MKPPKKIRVGPHDVSIIPMPEEHEATHHGAWKHDLMVIWLARSFPHKSLAVDTLLHELTHCVIDMFDLALDQGEEKFIGPFATAMTQVLRDNPKLVAWIMK